MAGARRRGDPEDVEDGGTVRALESLGLSYGPIRQPHELLDDPHLQQGGALVPTTLPDGAELSTAALPIEFDGLKAGKRNDPPASARIRTSILKGLGHGRLD